MAVESDSTLVAGLMAIPAFVLLVANGSLKEKNGQLALCGVTGHVRLKEGEPALHGARGHEHQREQHAS